MPHTTVKTKGVTLHQWTLGKSVFRFRPELGARLIDWKQAQADGSSREIIYWPADGDLEHCEDVLGGNPLLFPFSARTFHQGQIGKWLAPDGQVRPMPDHGFCRRMPFDITKLTDTGFTAVLQTDEQSHTCYPFNYRLEVTYTLEESGLSVSYCLQNLDTKSIPWSAGHHFYFKLPWHRNLSRNDYHFTILAKQCFTHETDGSLQPVTPFAANSSFGIAENSDRIFSDLTHDTVVFGPTGNDQVEVRIVQGTETASPWNSFVIWSESTDAPYYCVEPWMGPPNGPEHGKGLHWVRPNETAEFTVQIKLVSKD